MIKPFEVADFLRQVADHKLTILRDDGVYRHLRFAEPGTRCMSFDLVTWPGWLAYTGDMGTYVFERLEDMLQFFRNPEAHLFDRIDRRYWAEKCQAGDKGDGIREFSEDLFNQAVKEWLIDWIRSNAERTTREERRDLWDAVMDDVIGAECWHDGTRRMIALHEFSHQVNADIRFRFTDWESECKDYTHRFNWCCMALAWGINQYDAAKAGAWQAEAVAA